MERAGRAHDHASFRQGRGQRFHLRQYLGRIDGADEAEPHLLGDDAASDLQRSHRNLRGGAQHDADHDLLDHQDAQRGERLHVEGLTASGEVASYDLPLGEFARANEGAPTDPSTFNDYQKRRWEERSREPAAWPQ